MSADEKEIPFKLIWLDHIMLSDLTSSARHVGHVLVRHMDADGKQAFPSVPTIASLARMNEKTVRRSLDELAAGGWIVTTRRFIDGGEISSNHDATLPDGFANDGRSPLHDAEHRDERQREKAREKKARQRQHRRERDDLSPPKSTGGQATAQASASPRIVPMSPPSFSSVPPSVFRPVPPSKRVTEDALDFEVAQEDTPLCDFKKIATKKAVKEYVWGGVEEELERAAKTLTAHLSFKVGVPSEDIEDTPTLVAKFRSNYADLIAQSEREEWPEARLSKAIYETAIEQDFVPVSLLGREQVQ
jgi:hypothetical protein